MDIPYLLGKKAYMEGKKVKNAVIVDSVRTAIGRIGGSLKDVEVDFLAAKVIDEIILRTGIEKSDIDEVIFGQAKQSANSSNLARLALLRAGLPVDVPGYTVHRQCGSGVQSINNVSLTNHDRSIRDHYCWWSGIHEHSPLLYS